MGAADATAAGLYHEILPALTPEEQARWDQLLAEHRKLRALLVRLRDDSVMEDGFMTNAVGHRLLALGKVARELLGEVPER